MIFKKFYRTSIISSKKIAKYHLKIEYFELSRGYFYHKTQKRIAKFNQKRFNKVISNRFSSYTFTIFFSNILFRCHIGVFFKRGIKSRFRMKTCFLSNGINSES